MMYPALKHRDLLEEADIAEMKCDWSSSPTNILESVEESKQVDAVIISSVLALNPGAPNPMKF